MAFDFPNTPTVGQTVATPSGVFKWDGTKWVPATAASAPSLSVVRSYLAGLTLSTAGSSVTFAVAPGTAADSTNTAMMTLSTALSKTTSAWAAGSGNGALDTGAIANSTWYHVFLIQRTDTNAADVLVSLSASAPIMPSPYTLFRRIGAMKTNASGQWIKFLQTGDLFEWDVAVTEINGTTIGVSTLTLTGVPTGVKTRPWMTGSSNSASASTFYAWDADITGGAGQNFLYATGSAYTGSFNAILSVSSAAQLKLNPTVSQTSTFWWTIGYYDSRGRDA